jgi:uncharacterized protein YbaA (DUF1428 family)
MSLKSTIETKDEKMRGELEERCKSAANHNKEKEKEVLMHYVDGFVIPVPKKNLKVYARMARMGKEMWMKHGAIDYKECVGDDLEGTSGWTTFLRMMKLKPGETVVFSWIVYKSRAHRDRVNAKVMKEMEKMSPKEMPFDMKRMVYGGFKVLVDI